MTTLTKHSLSRTLYLLIASSGFAALSWEVIWQLKATLALGISAWGAALTLAVMMGGMSLGSFLMSYGLRKNSSKYAIRIYGSLEIIVGICGLFLSTAFMTLEKLDTWAYAAIPGSSALMNIIGIIAVFSIPTLCIGATFPLFGLIAEQIQVSIARLYSLNTLGAAASVLIVAFFLIPLLGVAHTIWTIAAINIAIGIAAWLLVPARYKTILIHADANQPKDQPESWKAIFIVFVTGYATFTLEIAWFRSFANIFPNTTDNFAIILACTLIALGLASRDIPILKQKHKLLGTQICIAGILILLMTPIIERLDISFAYFKQLQATSPASIHLAASVPANLDWLINAETFIVSWTAILIYLFQVLLKFFLVYFIIALPIRFLGTAFPWILDNHHSFRQIGKLYAINTIAAIIGAISAAWILLPAIGFAKTAWVTGILVMIAGISISPTHKRIVWTVIGIASLVTAMYFETGIGKTRVQGFHSTDNAGNPAKVLAFFEGPKETVSAIEYNDQSRALLINNSAASWESGVTYRPSIHYMAWMGHLPMLVHPNPKKALVICFGTGQTANAIRKENPEEIDIVDVNASIFKLAPYFRSNEGVLNDPKVKTIVMDGRAYIRRTKNVYDVITLEPMPPTTVGVNNLYSREFYQQARQKLSSNGVIAQWLPFHLISPHYAASIAKTFIDVFPNAILWFDQDSRTGILLGTKDPHINLTAIWPGFARTPIARDLSPKEAQQYIAFNPNELRQYANYGEIITDDNQLLAYGKSQYASGMLLELNFKLLRHINKKLHIDSIGQDYR